MNVAEYVARGGNTSQPAYCDLGTHAETIEGTSTNTSATRCSVCLRARSGVQHLRQYCD